MNLIVPAKIENTSNYTSLDLRLCESFCEFLLKIDNSLLAKCLMFNTGTIKRIGRSLQLQFVLKWIIFAVALYLTFKLGAAIGLDMKPSESWVENAIMALLVGLVNATLVRVIKFMIAPANCLTFGLAGVIVNALLFWLLFSLVPYGFQVGSFWAALFGSVVLGVLNGLLSALLISDNNKKKRDSDRET